MADLQQSEASGNGASPGPETLAATGLGAKRQRRPSVRLGDIGEQPAAIPYEPYVRRSKQWRISSHHPYPHGHGHHHPPKEMGKIPSKIRPLTNLVSDDGHDDASETPMVAEDKSPHPGDENLEQTMTGIRRGSRDGKATRRGGGPARRVRTNWISKVDEGMEGVELKSSGGGEGVGEEGYRDYDDMRQEEDSESPLKDQSPSDRRMTGLRISESRDVGPATAVDMVEVDAPSETDGREWNNGRRSRSFEDGGVRAWLNGLGLGRYAPVFEIHEVDDEVLPLLTLEDLKDMGINAVGSRRKIYCAIQKLRKSFS